jgi:hypothetical protein
MEILNLRNARQEQKRDTPEQAQHMKEDEWAPHKGRGGSHHHTEGGQRRIRHASGQIVIIARRRPAYGVWRRPAYGARFRVAFPSNVAGQSQAGEAVLQGVDEGPRQ